jgi:hypothetical protein
MKVDESVLLRSIFAGFATGAWLYGGWLFATEGVGAFAFVPGVVMTAVALLFYAADGGYYSAIGDEAEGES